MHGWLERRDSFGLIAWQELRQDNANQIALIRSESVAWNLFAGGFCVTGVLLATCCWVFVLAFDSQLPEQQDVPYRVGVSRIEITPFYPVRLNGFGGRRSESEGTSQKLWAKAMAISNADEPPLVILAVDNLGVRQEMVDQVAAALFEKYQIPRDNVALTFTHTHCAPKVRGASDTIFSSTIPPDQQLRIDRYTEELRENLITVAGAAIEARQPASLEWSVGTVGFAANRRTPGGPVDHDLPVMVARDLSGKPFAIYTSYACHCVTLSFNMFSGDWAGYAQESIEQEFPDATALVSIGCGSDANPVSGVTGDRVEMAREQGQQIGTEVKRLLSIPGRVLSGRLVAKRNSIALRLNDLPSREDLESQVAGGGATAFNAQWQLAKLERGEELLREIDYPIQSLSFGDQLQMVFLAGEVCVDYSLRLKKELNRDRVWIHGYSNDFCCYIPSERLLKEGGYGGGGEISYFALPATLKAGLEELIVNEVLLQAGETFRVLPGTRGVPPKSPDESLRLMMTHDDLRVELVAAEPLVADPVAIDFGSDGRMWVAEMPDYSRGVDEEFVQHGRIRVLADDDEDGKFDRSGVFLDGLRFPTDIKVWRDGVLVCDAPDILFAADRDGDGVVEVREVVATGFATHNPHARVNSLRFGLDGWLYGSGGLFGGKLTSANGEEVDTSGRDFRLQPDSGLIEPATGQTQQGRTRDDFDNWFGCTNGSLLLHYPYDERCTARSDIAPPTSIVSVPSTAHGQQLFPPANLVLFSLSGLPGRPTSACGAEIYRDSYLGQEYYGDAFVCEPVNQLVHRLKLRRNDDGGITGDRAENEAASEFLVSGDQWFRPVQARTGPDGALYVVDMYRFVIEHPQWIPGETLAELDVSAGHNLGRIYRVIRRDGSSAVVPRIDKKSNVEIAGLMDSTNGPLRDMVQQELVWRSANGHELETILEKTARDSNWSAARVQAAATLAQRGTLSDDLAIELLNNSNREVQRELVRLSEGRLSQSPRLADAVVSLIENGSAEVRTQVAFSGHSIPQEKLVPALVEIACGARTPLIEYSILASLPPESAPEFYRQCMEAGETLSIGFCQSLIDLAASNPAASVKMARQILALEIGGSVERRWRLIAHWQDDSSLSEHGTSKIVEQVKVEADEAMKLLRAEMADDAQRIAAIELVVANSKTGSAEHTDRLKLGDLAVLGRLLSGLQSPEVQLASLAALAELTPNDQLPLFLEFWEESSPRIRMKMIDRLLAKQQWARFLVGKLRDNSIRPGDLNATQRERLIEQCPELAEAENSLFASVGIGSRSEVLDDWRDSMTMKGESTRGLAIFGKHCSACHVLDGVGHAVGPDLAGLTNPTALFWFTAILDPNRDVDGRYLNFVAVTKDGQTLAGILAEESAHSVTLKEREGKTYVLLRRNLDEFRSGNKSMMPEGVEKDFSKEDLADLLSYLATPRTPARSFDGNRAEVVHADSDGSFELKASSASIHGTQIVFESGSPYRNIGYWSGQQDHVVWKFECEAAGRLDVYLDYACDPGSAGNPVGIDVGPNRLAGMVESTGAWSEYRTISLGTIDTVAGENSLRVGFGGPMTAQALFDLKRVVLCEEGELPSEGVSMVPR